MHPEQACGAIGATPWVYDTPANTAIVVERHMDFPHPPEKVWRMLTDKSKLAQWLYPASDDIKPIVGHRFAFSPPNGRSCADRIDCAVIAAEIGRRLSYTWRPSDGETVSLVSWQLEPIDGSASTRVHLRHDGALPGSAIPRLSASLVKTNPIRWQRFRRLAHVRHQFQGELQWL